VVGFGVVEEEGGGAEVGNYWVVFSLLLFSSFLQLDVVE
jgi:hypothetical protein